MKIFAFLLGLTSLSYGERSPNILLILVDDLGRQDIGVHGSSFHPTPHIDKLAKEGLVFENSYAVYPRCVPSRYGILSGRHPARDRVPGPSGEMLPLEKTTFGERLQSKGYRTGYVGKWHLGKAGSFSARTRF